MTPEQLEALLAERYGAARRAREQRRQLRVNLDALQMFGQQLVEAMKPFVPMLQELVSAFSAIGAALDRPNPHTHEGRMTLNRQRARARRRAIARLRKAHRA